MGLLATGKYPWQAAYTAYCNGAPEDEIAQIFSIPLDALRNRMVAENWAALRAKLPLVSVKQPDGGLGLAPAVNAKLEVIAENRRINLAAFVELRDHITPVFLARSGLFDDRRQFIICPAMERPARFCLLSSAPLFEKERHSRGQALCIEGFDPLVFHRPRTWTAFAANDGPINASERYLPKVLQERLDRQEAAPRWRFLEIFDSRNAVPAVLDADAPPNMRESGRECELAI